MFGGAHLEFQFLGVETRSRSSLLGEMENNLIYIIIHLNRVFGTGSLPENPLLKELAMGHHCHRWTSHRCTAISSNTSCWLSRYLAHLSCQLLALSDLILTLLWLFTGWLDLWNSIGLFSQDLKLHVPHRQQPWVQTVPICGGFLLSQDILIY